MIQTVAANNMPLEIPAGSHVRIDGRFNFDGIVKSAEAVKTFDAATLTWTITGWNIQLFDHYRGYIYYKAQDFPARIYIVEAI